MIANHQIYIVDKRSKGDKSYLTNKEDIESIFGSYSRNNIYWGDKNFIPSGLELLRQSLNRMNINNSNNINIQINKFRITEDRNNNYSPRQYFLKGIINDLTYRNRLFTIKCSFSGLINGKEDELIISQFFAPGGTYPGLFGEKEEVRNAVVKCLDLLAVGILN